MASDFWDERYSGADYKFGTEPADFVARNAYRVAPGERVLSIADGEGRNSVYLAERGAQVTGMDGSGVAIEKARKLAALRGVTVSLTQADITRWDWTPGAFDVVLGVFFQFAPPAMRADIFNGLAQTLAPGGLLLLHGYAPRQLGYGTGGPPVADNLWTIELMRESFAGFDVIEARDYDAEISEGTGHRGKSALIDFVARKPASTGTAA